jgi:hypothetical protein
MKYTTNAAAFIAVMLTVNVLAWNVETGLKTKTLTKAEVAARQRGRTTEGFQLSIATDKPTYSLGSPILVSVLVRNVSSQPLWVWQTDVEADYEIECVGSDGKAVLLTPYGRRLHAPDRPILHAFDVTLKPAESIEHVLPLDKLYDVSRAGVYNVTVTRKVLVLSALQTNGPPRFAEIRSNTIHISMLQ